MKLKSLAALIVRVIAIVGAVEFVFNNIEAKADLGTILISCVIAAIGGYALWRNSKKLAEVLCKGLDDEG